MAAGEFQVHYKINSVVTLLRNCLKLRKEKKLEELRERSLTEALVSRERRIDGFFTEAILSEDGVQSGVSLRAAEQDDWRQVCLHRFLCLYR